MFLSTVLEKHAATLFGEYATEGKSRHIVGINGDTYGLAGVRSWSSAYHVATHSMVTSPLIALVTESGVRDDLVFDAR